MYVNSFRDLRVWQIGMMLVERIYRVTRQFPSHETYGLTSQLRRAAISIPSNIAEEHARESTREFLKHVSIAQGSLAEVQTQVEISLRLGFLATSDASELMEIAASLSRQLFALRNSLKERIASTWTPGSPKADTCRREKVASHA